MLAFGLLSIIENSIKQALLLSLYIGLVMLFFKPELSKIDNFLSFFMYLAHFY